MEAVEIPRADDAARGDESVVKALGALLPLLGREQSVEEDRLWRLRADLLALLHSDDRRRIQRVVKAVTEVAGRAEAASVPTAAPLRPVRPNQGPGQAEVAILRSPPPSTPPLPPSPDMPVGIKATKP